MWEKLTSAILKTGILPEQKYYIYVRYNLLVIVELLLKLLIFFLAGMDKNDDQYFCKECRKTFKRAGYSKHLMFSYDKNFSKISGIRAPTATEVDRADLLKHQWQMRGEAEGNDRRSPCRFYHPRTCQPMLLLG